MIVTPIGGRRYFVIFVDEVSGHGRDFSVKFKDEAAEVPSWPERQSGGIVKEIVSDDRRK